MSTFALVPYSIRLRKAWDSDHYLKLGGSFNDHGIDIYSFLNDFLSNGVPSLDDYAETLENQSGEQVLEEEGKQVFLVEESTEEPGLIYGNFRSGEYGYAAPIIDIQTGGVAYTKSRLEAELLPYYFLIKIRPNSEIGIIILQTFNSLGIKDRFLNALYNQFKQKYSDFILEMNPLIPPGLIREYLQNKVLEIRLIKFGYPTDLMDVPQDDLPEHEIFEGTSELVIKPPTRKTFPERFTDQLKSKIDYFLDAPDSGMERFLEVKDFQYDTAKIKVKHGKGSRTVDLIKTGKLKYSEELDERVQIDQETGFPAQSSIDALSREFLNELEVTVWGSCEP